MKSRQSRVAGVISILIIVIMLVSCSSPISSSDNASTMVAQTMGALAIAQTLSALSATQTALVGAGAEQQTLLPTTTPFTPTEEAAAPVNHVLTPGDMPGSQSTIDDIMFNSDSFNTDLYERPYTSGTMIYRPDLDLQKVLLSSDANFFYFELGLFNVNPDTNGLVANYGAEIDVDRDGRGDYLVWVYMAPTSTTWDITGVVVYTDQNNDVGGPNPLLSDAPYTGDGYETEIWPGKPLTDPDGAWVRVNPADPRSIQFAVKRSLLGNPTSFLWSALADDGTKAPYYFDYNDIMTIQQAGSPYQNSSYYPLAGLALLDSTCRGAWNFTPTGNEPGYCKKTVQPTVAKTSAPKPTGTPTAKVITPTETCLKVQITAQVTDGSTWDPSWSSGVTLCIGSNCQHPDSSGYVVWYKVPGTYTIKASAPTYGITPGSATVKLGCGEKSLTQFVIGPG
jgi:hypothetical protein